MKATVFAVALAGFAALAPLVPAAADDGDSARLGSTATLIGQQSALTLEVVIPPGATVEVDRAAPSWNGVEVVSIVKTTTRTQGDRTIATIELAVAPFAPGAQSFAATVNVVNGTEVQPRQLPDVNWTVTPTLKPTDANELSPLATPGAIDGAESPLLKPAIGLGAIAGATVAVLVVMLVVRKLRSRPRPAAEAPETDAAPDLGDAERLLEHDPVAAYRALAAVVRAVITLRHDLPAYALTTGELRRRMEASGIDRWQARLVSGLLEECDAVVYAGYRPAIERRHADLTMAREIVEGAA